MFAIRVLLNCDGEMEIASIPSADCDFRGQTLARRQDFHSFFVTRIFSAKEEWREAKSPQFSSEIHFRLSLTSFALNNRTAYSSAP
jgi:hypothetical protein